MSLIARVFRRCCPLVLILGVTQACGGGTSPPSRVQRSEPAPQPPVDLDPDRERPADAPRLEISPSGLWHAELTSPGGALGFDLRIARSGSGYVARLPNGEQTVTLSELSWKGRELIVRAEGAQAELRAVHDGQRMTGTWSKPLADRSSSLAFTAMPGRHPRLGCAGEGEGAPPRVDGTWELKVGGAPARLELREVEHPSGDVSIHASLSVEGAEATSLAGCYADGALALSRFDGVEATLLRAEIDGAGRLRGQRWVDEGEPTPVEGARVEAAATKTRRSGR